MSLNLHAEGTANWQIDDAVIGLIESQVRPGMNTLETGAGQSTLAFAAAGSNHTAITPSSSEIAGIRAELEDRGLPQACVELIDGTSQAVLPNLPDTPLDLVLIDGSHGFPIPQVDWCYTAPRLKVGGKLIVDDIDLWTGRILVDFLLREPGWRLLDRPGGRTAVFELTQPCQLREWTDQPWVRHRSFWSQTRRKLRNAGRLLLRGELGQLRGKLRHDRDLRRARQS